MHRKASGGVRPHVADRLNDKHRERDADFAAQRSARTALILVRYQFVEEASDRGPLSSFAQLYDIASKYPPAKPGALGLWPLKAAGGDADAAPEIVSRIKRPVGALTRPQVQVATIVAVSARGSSAPNAGLPAPDCECSSVSPLRPVRPSIRNTLAPRNSDQRNCAGFPRTPAPGGSRSCP